MLAVVEFGEVPAIIVTVFSAIPERRYMPTATVHISAADLELSGCYEELGDVLYLSAVADDKSAAAQETPQGHAVRLDTNGHITHITAINARWLLDPDGERDAS